MQHALVGNESQSTGAGQRCDLPHNLRRGWVRAWEVDAWHTTGGKLDVGCAGGTMRIGRVARYSVPVPAQLSGYNKRNETGQPVLAIWSWNIAMYLKHFGLDRKPFEQLPDPEFLFLSEKHDAALSSIGFAVAIQDSFVIITGEIGSGKTTLLHKFLSEELSDAVVVYVTQTRVSATELLQAILVELGADPFGKGKVELTTMLKRLIDGHHRDGNRVVIVIDEAQNLTARVLEELRLVTCVSPGSRKQINVVLVGQPQFNKTIDSPDLEQLKQRCRLRYHLKALTEDETREYIEHRLKVAGGSMSKIFEPGVEAAIYQHCRGIPRLINMLCDTALIFAFVRELPQVNEEAVSQAVKELGWQSSVGQPGQEGIGQEAKTSAGDVLAVLVDDDNGTEYPVRHAMCVIGRAVNCTVRIRHPALSRYHALMKCINDDWTIADMKSTNGVYLNGRRIGSATLRPNDLIGIGEFTFIFKLPTDASSSQAAIEGHSGTLPDFKAFRKG
jgi:general secretion pathway protein A